MNFHIVTLFPYAFDSYLNESIIKRAIEDRVIKVFFYDPKDFENNPKKRVDDKPYGGGPGMVIRALPVIKAIEKAKGRKKKVKIIFFCPRGKQFTNEYAKETANNFNDIILVCGRYEGVDARVKEIFSMDDVSVGPFVLTGGELPAMIVMDCMARQVEGVLGDIQSLEESRNAADDVYTRPEEFEYKRKKYQVPPVLISGNHAKIEEWRKINRIKE